MQNTQDTELQRHAILPPIVPPPHAIIIHNRHPRPLIHIAAPTPTPLPPIVHIDPRPAPLSASIPPAAPKTTLTPRRLHVPVVLILRPAVGTVRPLAPDLALAVHVLGAIGRRGARAVARARAHFDVLRRAVVAARRRRRGGDVDGSRRRLDEHGNGLGRRDRERPWLRCRDCDVGC